VPNAGVERGIAKKRRMGGKSVLYLSLYRAWQPFLDSLHVRYSRCGSRRPNDVNLTSKAVESSAFSAEQRHRP
jgi:hypothetical protein